MNKIFKLKWNQNSQSWVICSELAKKAGKISGKGILFSIGTIFGFNSAFADIPTHITTDTNIEAGELTNEISDGSVITIDNNATATLKGSLTVNIQNKSGGGEPLGFNITNGNFIGKDKVSINFQPTGKDIHSRPKGMIVRGKSNVDLENLTINTIFANETANYSGSADSNASYGVAVGYGYHGGNSSDKSVFTVNNADINITNTASTIYSTRTVGSGFVSATVTFGHQLSGLKIYRNNGAIPEFTSNGKLNINVTDSSNAKAGDYLAGVYISGNGSKATFNGDTKITVAANGVNSAGIKIGKPFDAGTDVGVKGSEVIANGKLTVDTRLTKDSAAIRLFGDSSKLEITGKNTEEQSLIYANNSAIVFDTQDYKLSARAFILPIKASRNENGSNQSVKLKNTRLQTDSATASLIKVKAEKVVDETFGQASKFSDQLNHGDFNVKNASFELSGEKSLATAADKGWLIEVQGQENNSSELTATVDDKAKVVGLVHKDKSSVLNMAIKNKSMWKLSPKAGEITSTLTELTLENGILDASELSITSQDLASLAEEKAKAEKDKEQKLSDLKNLVRSGFPNASEAELEAKFEAAKVLIKDDLDKLTTKIESATAILEKGVHSNYAIKLTSNGTDKDGIFINNGTITLANTSYNDVLTIEGNYEGGSEATLKVNTHWDSLADKESSSDILEIKGTATGKTKIVGVRKNGAENVIDGSIGSIADDLHKNSAVVVRVHNLTAGNANAFEGTAKTTGAGELQIAEREKDGVREYFWTVTALNRNDIPILTADVAGYAQTPQVNFEQGYASLARLHTRRGENQPINWDNLGQYNSGIKGQGWARLFANHVFAQGKQRFSFNTDLQGIQIGYDFAIQRTEKNIHHLTGVYASYSKARTKFADQFRTENAIIVDDKYTGKAQSQSWSLGVTHTRYDENGSYIDLVGQLSWLNNYYSSRDSVRAKNKAFGYALSAEIGRPYILGKHKSNEVKWLIEPQAQLTYQFLHTKGFNADNRGVYQGNSHALRVRAGLRLAYNQFNNTVDLKTKTIYFTADILHDFVKPRAVKVGLDRISEKYAETWFDLGVGIQHTIGKNAYIYLDGHYESDFSGLRKREGYRGSLGIKYNWK